MTKELRLLRLPVYQITLKFWDYNSAYLSVPLLVTLTSNASEITGIADTDTLPYAKSVGFKQSFLSMVNSIIVDLNGQPMVQQNQLFGILRIVGLLLVFILM